MISVAYTLKKKIAPVLHRLSFVSRNSLYMARYKHAVRVFMFHGVGGSDCPADVFALQMQYLKKHYSVISLKAAVEKVVAQNFYFSNEVVLTFDDGLRNNFTVAYPILLQLGLPATFFVCPSLIETRVWLWAYEMEQRLLTITNFNLSILCKKFSISMNPNNSNDMTVVLEQIIEWMKTLDTVYRKSVEAAVRELTPDFMPTQTHLSMFESMTWDELRSLSPELITIGSHTVSHPILTKLSLDEMRFEIEESKRWLEQSLNRPVEYFCYPNGDMNEEIVDTVRAAYRAAVTTEPGFFSHGQDIYKINRIPAAQNMPLFAWRMFRPSA